MMMARSNGLKTTLILSTPFGILFGSFNRVSQQKVFPRLIIAAKNQNS
jgi:hypothetical protein